MDFRTSLIRLFTVTIASFLLFGCASETQVSSAVSIPYSPKPGKGLVILYREGTSIWREGWVGKIVNFRHLYDNGHDVGNLSGGTFILDDASPGQHSFTANDEEKKTVLNVDAGKTYFIRADLRTGMWRPSEVLEQVELAEGAAALKDLKKSEPL